MTSSGWPQACHTALVPRVRVREGTVTSTPDTSICAGCHQYNVSSGARLLISSKGLHAHAGGQGWACELVATDLGQEAQPGRDESAPYRKDGE